MNYLLRHGLILISAVTLSVCQQYHSPAEILKLMEASKVSYSFDNLAEADITTAPAPVPLSHGLFLKQDSGGGYTVTSYGAEYQGKKEYTENVMEAEKLFSGNDHTGARAAYLKALDAAPASSQVMTFIGQTYEQEENDSLAGVWFHRAIAANKYDYMAHWFLADLLDKSGKNDEAIREIILAKILNRSNPRVSDAVERIFKRSGHSYADWEFTPRCAVERSEQNRLKLKVDMRYPEWLPYAACKAVWQGEPGYPESMLKGTKEPPLLVEEKECVVNVLMGMTNRGGTSKERALRILPDVWEKSMFAEYVIYEVILPTHPSFVFYLSDENLAAISDYVRTFRME